LSESEETSKSRRPRRPFPKNTLEEALIIPQTINDQNAGNPMKRILLAGAIRRKPTSSEFKYLLSSSKDYGLTKGTEKAEFIELTSLGKDIAKATDQQEKIRLLQEAIQKPTLLKAIFSYYKDAKLPSEEILKKTLEDQFKVHSEWADECIRILVSNGRFTRIIRDVSGTPYVILEVPTLEEKKEEEEIPPTPPSTPPTAQPPLPTPLVKQIFVGHGKNKAPLEQLKGILDQFKIPYKVAIDEPHRGRPISKKVADIMKGCSSAIFVFTGDEEYIDAEGNKSFRPSDNVVYELGAATILYENRIVIFKEEGVTFPSDFRDFGYIAFEKDNIEAKSMDLLKELVGFGFLKIMPA